MQPLYPREILNAANTPAFFVTNLVNIRYLTGIEMSAGCLLVRRANMTLYTDARYLEVVKKTASDRVKIGDIGGIERAMSRIQKCGLEATDVTLDRRRRWRRIFPNTKFVQKNGIIEEFRRSKEPGEIRNFRRAQRITKAMYKRIPVALKPGITERQLAWKIHQWAHKAGADGASFDPIVAFGSHTSSPHHHASDRKLKKRDIVQIDMGVKYKGYCSDQSRVFFVGDPTVEQAKVYKVVQRAKEAAEKSVQVGMKASELDAVARNSLKQDGYEKFFTHALGHGVGLEIHEGVSISCRSTKDTLLQNEIITIEPGVYIPGKFGIRLEDEIVVR